MMTAPHRSSLMSIEPQWIDINGHLNMAYYHVLFDRGADQLFEEFGFGPEYIKTTGFSTFSAEFHVCYLRELHEGNRVYVTSQLIEFDTKRFHFFQQLFHEDGWLSATGEGMGLHIDLSGPRVVAMPDAQYAKMQKVMDAHADLPRPDRLGRRISMSRD